MEESGFPTNQEIQGCAIRWQSIGYCVDFLEKGTINTAVYNAALERIRATIGSRRSGLFTKGELLLHDNAPPQTAISIREL